MRKLTADELIARVKSPLSGDDPLSEYYERLAKVRRHISSKNIIGGPQYVLDRHQMELMRALNDIRLSKNKESALSTAEHCLQLLEKCNELIDHTLSL